MKSGAVEPLLDLLERRRSLRLQIAVSGHILEHLQEEAPKLLARFAELAKTEQIDLLIAPKFDPELAYVSMGELMTQLDESRSSWSSADPGRELGTLIPFGWKEGLQEALLGRGARYAFINASSLMPDALEAVLGGAREAQRQREGAIPPVRAALIGKDGQPLEAVPAADDQYLVLLPVVPIENIFTAEAPSSVRARLSGIDSFLDTTAIKRDTDPRLFMPLVTIDPVAIERSGGKVETFRDALDRLFARASVSATLNFLRGTQIYHKVTTGLRLGTDEKNVCLLSASSFVSPSDPAEDVRRTPERARLFYRLLHLAEELDPLPAHIKRSPNEKANLERLERAKKAFSSAFSRSLYSDDPRTGLPAYPFRRAFQRAVLVAQVEADTIRNPEIDPSVGWVRHELIDYDQDGEEEVVIDTQLIRLYIERSRAARIVELDYKPRKVDLLNIFDPTGQAATSRFLLLPTGGQPVDATKLREALASAPQTIDSKLTVTKRTLDLLELAFEHPIAGAGGQSSVTRLCKHLQVKSGIGSHLPNSTTGFSTEVWLEGQKPPEGTLLLAQFSFMLPSGDPDVLSTRPLVAFGGAFERAFGCHVDHVFLPQHVPGGAYGIRLIDGIDSFILELRCSKPLPVAAVLPIWHKDRDGRDRFGGSMVICGIDAAKILGDDRSATFFLSIK